MVAFLIKVDRFGGLRQFRLADIQVNNENQRMFYEYIRSIYGWKVDEEIAQRDSILDVLKDLGFDNSRLYEGQNKGVESYEFTTVARMIKVEDKYYPSSEGERFIFFSPLGYGSRQCYVSAAADRVLDGAVYHWTEFSERLAILFSMLVKVIPPFMTIQPGARITFYPDESRIDIQMKGELIPKIPFEQYRSYTQWMKSETGGVICIDCGREGDGQTLCDCWTLKEDWDMEEV